MRFIIMPLALFVSTLSTVVVAAPLGGSFISAATDGIGPMVSSPVASDPPMNNSATIASYTPIASNAPMENATSVASYTPIASNAPMDNTTSVASYTPIASNSPTGIVVPMASYTIASNAPTASAILRVGVANGAMASDIPQVGASPVDISKYKGNVDTALLGVDIDTSGFF